MFQQFVMQVKTHKTTLIKVGAALLGAVLGGVAAAFLVREEEYEDESLMLNLEEDEVDEDEIEEE